MRQRRASLFNTNAAHAYEAEEGDLNPSSYISNLSDCMLVMVCGLLVALVVAWNVDLPHVMKVKTEEMTQIDNVEDLATEIEAGGGNYNEMGKVYQDPETGTLYMLQKIDEE